MTPWLQSSRAVHFLEEPKANSLLELIKFSKLPGNTKVIKPHEGIPNSPLLLSHLQPATTEDGTAETGYISPHREWQKSCLSHHPEPLVPLETPNLCRKTRFPSSISNSGERGLQEVCIHVPGLGFHKSSEGLPSSGHFWYYFIVYVREYR